MARWVAKHGTPPKERSLFSQLKSTGSFGERVARRLEVEYRMGAGFLDAADAEVAPSSGGLADALKLTCESAKELRLLSVYRLANEAQRQLIDIAVDEVRRELDDRIQNQT